MLAGIDRNRLILLVMALDIELLLMVQLARIDRGGYIRVALAKYRQRRLVDVVIHQHDGLLRLFNQICNLHVGIEDLAVVEYTLNGRQRGTDEEINLAL